MPQTPWSTQKIQQCEREIGQAMLRDEHTLVFYGQDFGKIIRSQPAAVCIPNTLTTVQTLLHFAQSQHLPITIRSKGLSQGGQSLPLKGGVTLQIAGLDKILDHEKDSIWVETNSTWAEVLAVTLQKSQMPYVVPYNCHLSVGGVLSAAGIGASSFQYGPISGQVLALEVILADGSLQIVNKDSPLFHACLSGQGQFAVMTKACLRLRTCLPQVRTFSLVYLDQDSWLADLSELKKKANYLEAFCSPALQGTKWVKERRVPFAQWLFSIQVSIEYERTAPEFQSIFSGLNPWKIIHTQDESIHSYLHRHDGRFEMMRLTGQWDFMHPWYECFMPKELLTAHLSELLSTLPLHYLTLLQVVPVARMPSKGFFVLPEGEEIFELMILNPGVNPALISPCLDAIQALDDLFLSQGGKRYLSGYLGSHLPKSYWQNHLGSYYAERVLAKKTFDPAQVFNSYLINFASFVNDENS